MAFITAEERLQADEDFKNELMRDPSRVTPSASIKGMEFGVNLGTPEAAKESLKKNFDDDVAERWAPLLYGQASKTAIQEQADKDFALEKANDLRINAANLAMLNKDIDPESLIATKNAIEEQAYAIQTEPSSSEMFLSGFTPNVSYRSDRVLPAWDRFISEMAGYSKEEQLKFMETKGYQADYDDQGRLIYFDKEKDRWQAASPVSTYDGGKAGAIGVGIAAQMGAEYAALRGVQALAARTPAAPYVFASAAVEVASKAPMVQRAVYKLYSLFNGATEKAVKGARAIAAADSPTAETAKFVVAGSGAGTATQMGFEQGSRLAADSSLVDSPEVLAAKAKDSMNLNLIVNGSFGAGGLGFSKLTAPLNDTATEGVQASVNALNKRAYELGLQGFETGAPPIAASPTSLNTNSVVRVLTGFARQLGAFSTFDNLDAATQKNLQSLWDISVKQDYPYLADHAALNDFLPKMYDDVSTSIFKERESLNLIDRAIVTVSNPEYRKALESAADNIIDVPKVEALDDALVAQGNRIHQKMYADVQDQYASAGIDKNLDFIPTESVAKAFDDLAEGRLKDGTRTMRTIEIENDVGEKISVQVPNYSPTASDEKLLEIQSKFRESAANLRKTPFINLGTLQDAKAKAWVNIDPEFETILKADQKHIGKAWLQSMRDAETSGLVPKESLDRLKAANNSYSNFMATFDNPKSFMSTLKDLSDNPSLQQDIGNQILRPSNVHEGGTILQARQNFDPEVFTGMVNNHIGAHYPLSDPERSLQNLTRVFGNRSVYDTAMGKEFTDNYIAMLQKAVPLARKQKAYEQYAQSAETDFIAKMANGDTSPQAVKDTVASRMKELNELSGVDNAKEALQGSLFKYIHQKSLTVAPASQAPDKPPFYLDGAKLSQTMKELDEKWVSTILTKDQMAFLKDAQNVLGRGKTSGGVGSSLAASAAILGGGYAIASTPVDPEAGLKSAAMIMVASYVGSPIAKSMSYGSLSKMLSATKGKSAGDMAFRMKALTTVLTEAKTVSDTRDEAYRNMENPQWWIDQKAKADAKKKQFRSETDIRLNEIDRKIQSAKLRMGGQ
jgi:hypothetical protein